MPGTSRHLLEQGRVISALGRLAFSAAKQRIGGQHHAMNIPGPVFQERINPPSARLVGDYLRAVGGNPRHYRDTIPAHLFPQWSFPLAARALEGIHYPIEKVLNGGCSVQLNVPLPAGEPLELLGQLESVDETDGRVVLRTRITTSTARCRDAVVAILESYIPEGKAEVLDELSVAPGSVYRLRLRKSHPEASTSRCSIICTSDWRHQSCALGSSLCTSNGVSWTILHGFSTMAHAIEGLNRSHFSADVTRLASFRAKFTRPWFSLQRLVYISMGTAAFVGDSPGGPAYMVGDYTTCTPTHARPTHDRHYLSSLKTHNSENWLSLPAFPYPCRKN